MKVCVVGVGFIAERNVELFSTKHSVSIFVPYPISVEESTALSIRMSSKCPIFYDPSSLSTMDLFVICIELPFNDVKNEVVMDRFLETSQAIRRFAHPGSTVIVETKVGVGVTRKFFTGLEVHCSYSPNRITQDTINSDIKLVGGLDEESEVLAMQFLETVYTNVVRTGSAEVAEAVVMLDAAKATVQEAVINEFADFCTNVDVDIHQVIDAASVGDRRLTRDPRLTLPWVGRKRDIDSALTMTTGRWPVLATASEQLTSRPSKVYKQIVERFCNGDFDKLHKMAFLVVGLGTTIGSASTTNSPVLEIIRNLELEGASVSKYDMFVDEYSEIPTLKHNSGRCKYDGIIVMHPYMVPNWKGEYEKKTLFFCRH